MFSHFDMKIRLLHQQVVRLSRPLIGESDFGTCYHEVDVVISIFNLPSAWTFIITLLAVDQECP